MYMRERIFQMLITIVFLLLILLPLLQQITSAIPDPPMREKRRLAPMPNMALRSYISGEYQNQFNAYMNDNFGFRRLMVMINNQINIDIFHVTR